MGPGAREHRSLPTVQPVGDVKYAVVVGVEIVRRRQQPDALASIPQHESAEDRVKLHAEVVKVGQGWYWLQFREDLDCPITSDPGWPKSQ